MELPSMEKEFEFNQVDATGKVYKGKFVYKRLSIGDQLRASAFRTRLNGDVANPFPAVDEISHMISWLQYGIIDSPDWWKECSGGADLYDDKILRELYKLVEIYERDFEKKVDSNVKRSRSDSDK